MQEHLIAIGGCSTLRLKGVRYGTNHLVFRATKTQIRRIMTKCKSDKKFSFRIYSAGAAQKPNRLELGDGELLPNLLLGILLGPCESVWEFPDEDAIPDDGEIGDRTIRLDKEAIPDGESVLEAWSSWYAHFFRIVCIPSCVMLFC